MLRNKFSLLLITLLLATNAYTKGNEGGVGNGGDGVYFSFIFDNKPIETVYLLDLVEFGVESSPFIGVANPANDRITRGKPNHTTNYGFKQYVEYGLSSLPKEIPQALLAKKLIYIATLGGISGQDFGEISKGEYLASAILNTVKSYNWRFVNYPLVDLPDDRSFLSFEKKSLVQIAVRSSRTVKIYKRYWNMMNDENKIALIIHEALYALIPPMKNSKGGKYQDSSVVREVVGMLFSKRDAHKVFHLLDTFYKGLNRSRLITSGNLAYLNFRVEIDATLNKKLVLKTRLNYFDQGINALKISNFCTELFKFGTSKRPDFAISSMYDRRSFEVKYYTHGSGYRSSYFKDRLLGSFWKSRNSSTGGHGFNDVANCTKLLTGWFVELRKHTKNYDSVKTLMKSHGMKDFPAP